MAGDGLKNVLYVVPHNMKVDEERQSCVSQLGFVTRTLTPTPLSAFTSVVIANECSKQSIDIVHAFRPDDAMAAISARKISSNKNFKVVLEFPDNAPRPRSLNKEIIAGVDVWVFATDRLADLAPASGKPTLIMTTLIDANEKAHKLPEAAQKHLLWVGPLEKNIDNLKEAIRLIGHGDGCTRLTVLGTGTARYAMQAVKMSRAIPDPALVQWLGNDYNLDEAMQSATAIVQSQADPTPLELDLASKLCLCKATPDGFVISVESPLDAQHRAEKLTDFYRQA